MRRNFLNKSFSVVDYSFSGVHSGFLRHIMKVPKIWTFDSPGNDWLECASAEMFSLIPWGMLTA